MHTDDRVKHKRYGWDGRILAVVRNPYFSGMAPRIQVRFTVGGASFNRLAHPDDIDIIAPIAPVTPPVEPVQCVSAVTVLYPPRQFPANVVDLGAYAVRRRADAVPPVVA